MSTLPTIDTKINKRDVHIAKKPAIFMSGELSVDMYEATKQAIKKAIMTRNTEINHATVIDLFGVFATAKQIYRFMQSVIAAIELVIL